MNWFKIVKDNYDAGYYSPADAAVFVVKGKITAAQYQGITDQPYSA